MKVKILTQHIPFASIQYETYIYSIVRKENFIHRAFHLSNKFPGPIYGVVYFISGFRDPFADFIRALH